MVRWQLMANRAHRRVLFTIIATAGWVLAACSGDDGESSPTTVSAAPTSTADHTPPTSSTSTGPEGSATPSTMGAGSATLPPFGAAAVTPPVVADGDTITVTPPGAVQRICLNYASIYANRDGTLRQVAVAGTDDRPWQLDNSQVPFTYPGCEVGPSADPTAYRISDDLAAGDYLMCLEPEPTAVGCGAFTVETS